MKPIGYYIDTKIPLIGEMEQSFGSCLQGLTKEQKIYLVFNLAGNLEDSFPYVHPANIEELCSKINKEISEESDAIGLMKALVNSL